MQRKTSRDKGKAPPPPPLQSQQSTSSSSSSDKDKGPAPPPPIIIPPLPTPPSSPMTPPDTPPDSSPIRVGDIPLPPPPPPLPLPLLTVEEPKPEPSRAEERKKRNRDVTDDVPPSSVNISEIRRALEKQLNKRLSQEKVQPLEKVSDVVTVTSSSATTPDDSLNFVVVSTPQSERNKNTSMITINSNLPDTSNSLASNISQVSVKRLGDIEQFNK